MKFNSLIAALLLLSSANAQITNTQFGPVQGKTAGNTYAYLGIPFAKPPVGELRWRAPENPIEWTNTKITTEYAPACTQVSYNQGDTTPYYRGQEDCLYLNVWTPKNNTGKLPVMVFIHGGGNQQGSAGQNDGGTTIYDGQNLCSRGNVIVVSIQYRLGPLGFLVHPGLEEAANNNKAGNYAVMDQLLALNWVKHNISNFGGDSTNVTVFGESAGALNTGNLLISPKASGLIHKAIMQSGVPVINTYNAAIDSGIAYVNKFITTGTDNDKITYLRGIAATELVKGLGDPVSGGKVNGNWRPCVDGNLFTNNSPIALIKNGQFNHIPLLIGTNADEMSLSVPNVITPAAVSALINTLPAANRAAAAVLYPPGNNNTQARTSYLNLLNDAQFHSTTRRLAQCIAANQSQPVYRYYLTFKHSLAALQNLGSYHGIELSYVFNNWENATLGKGVLFKPADDSMQKNCLNYWVNFAKTGNPNATGFTNWPQYDASTQCYLELKASPVGTLCHVIKDRCDFWDQVTFHSPCVNKSIAQTQAHKPITAYPNPSRGEFVLLNLPSASRVIVHNSAGKTVPHTLSNNILQIQASYGLYFCTIQNTTSMQILKMQIY